MNRRTVLFGAGALVVSTLAAGGVSIAMLDRTDFFASVLRRYLPDAIVPDVEIAEFADVYWPIMAKRYGSRAALMPSLETVDRLFIPGEMDEVEQMERDILTNFLIGSNFFGLKDPKTEPIDFTGLVVACSNPFQRV